jgi:hypothetical protein
MNQTPCETIISRDLDTQCIHGSWDNASGWNVRPSLISKVSEQNISKSPYPLMTSESLSPWIGRCIRTDRLHGHAIQPGCTSSIYSNRAANLDIRHRIKMESCKKSSNMCVGDKKIWQGSYFTKRNDKVRIHRKKRVGIV